MRYLLFVALSALVIAGLGCLTDYGIITDNDQSRPGVNDGPIVNTNGKAHVKEAYRGATIWPDGTDELFSFVDQKSDGTATITTYNNYSTGSEPIFHDDLYCNTSWTGCSIFTAPDDNDENLFDGRWNPSCSGARSLSILYSTGRYYGECGSQQAKLRVEEKISLLNGAVAAKAYGRGGLLWKLDSSNTTIRVRNLTTGASVNVPFYGASAEFFWSRTQDPAFLWLDHPMLGVAFRDYANRLDDELYAEALEVTITHNGVPIRFSISGGDHPVVNSSVWRERANRSF